MTLLARYMLIRISPRLRMLAGVIPWPTFSSAYREFRAYHSVRKFPPTYIQLSKAVPVNTPLTGSLAVLFYAREFERVRASTSTPLLFSNEATPCTGVIVCCHANSNTLRTLYLEFAGYCDGCYECFTGDSLHIVLLSFSISVFGSVWVVVK